jgi:hypothetical protein
MARSTFHRIFGAFKALGVCIALCNAQEGFEPAITAESENSPIAVGDQLFGDGFESIVDTVDSAEGVNYASLLVYDWLIDEFA